MSHLGNMAEMGTSAARLITPVSGTPFRMGQITTCGHALLGSTSPSMGRGTVPSLCPLHADGKREGGDGG